MKTALLIFLLATLPASGPISLGAVQTEFARGGANPISLNEYYKPGTYVLAGDTAPNVPASGAISLSNFHGATAVFTLSASIAPTTAFGTCATVCTAITDPDSLCSAAGGTPPYTYAWTYISGTVTTNAQGAGGPQTRYWSLTSPTPVYRTAVYRCTVTDSATPTAATAIANVAVTLDLT